MRKKILFLSLSGVILMGGCEKRLVEFPLPINRTDTFQLDEADGNFDETVMLTTNDIKNAIKVHEDAEITFVRIEALAVKVTVKTGNEAESINVTGEIVENGGPTIMFENFIISLAENSEIQPAFVGINPLALQGISRLKAKLEGFIFGLDYQSFDIRVRGSSSPVGQRVVVDLQLRIKASLTYERCVDVATSFIEGGEPCE